MLKTYDKKIILFPAGTGGNFLGTFLSMTNDSVLPNFRIDWKQKNQAIDFVGPRTFEKFNETEYLVSVDNWVNNPDTHTMISHYPKISNLIKYSDNVWVRKIVPVNGILTYCKNVFFKKQNLEFVSYHRASLINQLDGMLMNINDFYQKYLDDQDCPTEFLIDFARMYDINYLTELFIESNGVPPSANKIRWAEEYIGAQFKVQPYPDSKNMNEIIQAIDPQDVFDLAAVLFVYENNWQTVDQNRLWTINDFPNSIEESKKFLIDNAYNYKFFKETSNC